MSNAKIITVLDPCEIYFHGINATKEYYDSVVEQEARWFIRKGIKAHSKWHKSRQVATSSHGDTLLMAGVNPKYVQDVLARIKDLSK